MIPCPKETIVRCRKGDKKAQKALFEGLYAPLYRVCYRYLSHEQEAEDCLMRAFMKAFQKLDSFRYEGDHSFFAWIRRIAINECLMALRSKSQLMLSSVDGLQIAQEPDALDNLSAEELYQLISGLPTGYRTVFNLYVVEGYSHAEIAGMLGISENTSRTQLAKARQRLQSQISQHYLISGTHA